METRPSYLPPLLAVSTIEAGVGARLQITAEHAGKRCSAVEQRNSLPPFSLGIPARNKILHCVSPIYLSSCKTTYYHNREVARLAQPNQESDSVQLRDVRNRRSAKRQNRPHDFQTRDQNRWSNPRSQHNRRHLPNHIPSRKHITSVRQLAPMHIERLLHLPQSQPCVRSYINCSARLTPDTYALLIFD